MYCIRLIHDRVRLWATEHGNKSLGSIKQLNDYQLLEKDLLHRDESRAASSLQFNQLRNRAHRNQRNRSGSEGSPLEADAGCLVVWVVARRILRHTDHIHLSSVDLFISWNSGRAPASEQAGNAEDGEGKAFHRQPFVFFLHLSVSRAGPAGKTRQSGP